MIIRSSPGYQSSAFSAQQAAARVGPHGTASPTRRPWTIPRPRHVSTWQVPGAPCCLLWHASCIRQLRESKNVGPSGKSRAHEKERAVSILTWIVLGLIAGWLASLLMGRGHGLLGDIIL